jgi:phage terminase large subunit
MLKDEQVSLEEVSFAKIVNWTEKQYLANDAVSKYKYILYGGAMGGGKSYWLRWELIKLLLFYYAKYKLENVTVGLFCEDYPALRDRHLNKIKFELPEWLGSFNAQDHNFILKKDYGSGILSFRNLDDVSKYQSSEFASEGVDELTKDTEETFIFLRTRLRWPGISNFDTKFIAGTNPGGIGHAWVKKKWILKEFEPNEQEADMFYFIPAKAIDNPHLDQGYYKSLESLPDPLKRAFLEGDWDLFKGQYFSEWRNEIHTCKPFEIQRDWTRFICIDYGYAKPSACYWCAVSPEGIVYVYRELYKTGLTHSALTKEIIAMTPANEDIRYWVIDPSAWIKSKENENQALSGAEIMETVYREATKKTLLLMRGNNDRLSGWSTLREYLKPTLNKDSQTIAKIQVFTTCYELIKTLPSLIFDAIKVEDLDTEGEDHAADAIRYGLMSRPVPSRTPDQVLDDFFKKKTAKAIEKNKQFKMTGY